MPRTITATASSESVTPPSARGSQTAPSSSQRLPETPSLTQTAVQTRAETKVAEAPYAIRVWKDSAAAAQSTLTAIGIVAGAIWFLTRRQRFPRANVEHDVSHWRIGDHVILHTLVKVKNVGEVALHLDEVSIRAQRIFPTPTFVLDALREGRDPVAEKESEVLWPSANERTCDWRRKPHTVEPGETEEIPFDLVIPATVSAVEVYTYIRNTKQKRRNIGWGTNTIYALTSEIREAVRSDAPIVGGDVATQERLEIMAKTIDRGNVQDVQKQAPLKTPTQSQDKTIQAPQKTPTSGETGTGKK